MLAIALNKIANAFVAALRACRLQNGAALIL